MIRIIYLLVLTMGLGACDMNSKSELKPTYIITETGKYGSLDPLLGDLTTNLPIQRMLFATPLEVSPTDHYESFLLESFKYEKDSKTLKFIVKKDIYFSDGSAITAEDIALSITRMIKKRPHFPVIKEIRGAKEWVIAGADLSTYPSGIVVKDQSIQIQFEELYHSPLARFCMEIFGVIPKKCVNLKTNEITCKTPPSSGPYVIKSESAKEIQFAKNPSFKSERSFLDEITVKYQAAEDVPKIKDLKKGEVIATNEGLFSTDEYKTLEENFDIKRKPASRFKLVLLMDSGPFKDIKCRQAFANEFRQSAVALGERLETSVFTKLLSGYKKFEPHAVEKCALKKPLVKWGYSSKRRDPQFLKIMNHLRVHSKNFNVDKPVEFVDSSKYASALKNGDIHLMPGTTGFWAADPVGDIRMLFTPNMHATLSHVSGDPKLQSLLLQLEKDRSKAKFEEVNEYIYEDARFNVFRHSSRFYLTKKGEDLKHLPFGITSPAPYTLMEAALK